jgi:general secretion pathway protein L
MTFKAIIEAVSAWLDCVAAAIVVALGRLMSPRNVRLIEESGGAFAIETSGPPVTERVRIDGGQVIGALPESVAMNLRGNRLELVLRPDSFLFRPLELPQRAAEFLAGIVRAQIDRVTPWTADEAVFGWSAPTDAGSDRIVVTVAATARAKIAPYVQALGAFNPQSIAVFTAPQEALAGAAPIKILEDQRHGTVNVHRIRRGLVALLVLSAVLAGAAAGADFVVGGNLADRQDELARKITQRRAAIRAGGELNGDSVAGAERILARRKHTNPSTVIVLEALSQILPDHTYVTELRIEGDKLRVIGVTQDAPSLIRLIEQSSHFTHATFFAPTTRSPADPGERFHIEARIEPVFSSRS